MFQEKGGALCEQRRLCEERTTFFFGITITLV